jgi:carboxyl-terminal processing protease
LILVFSGDKVLRRKPGRVVSGFYRVSGRFLQVKSMKSLLSRLFLGVGGVSYLILSLSCGQPPKAAAASADSKPQQPALAQNPAQNPPSTMPAYAASFGLETAAVQAASTGDFDRSDQLLNQAAKLSHDAQIEQMASWVNDFEAQRKTFNDQRHDQFEKALGDVHLLLSHKMDTYAIDEAARAYLLTDDKDAFSHEKWMAALIQESATAADQDESAGLWLKAWRMYEDLNVLEPAAPAWKSKLKLATLRLRLLLIYTPDQWKKLQDVEAHDRQAADDLLHPTTQPSATAKATTTQPDIAAGIATRPSEAGRIPDEDVTSADWHDMTRGIQFDMLLDALDMAAHQYYRDVTFQDLLKGGLNGLETIMTTDGLEDAFPGLKDRDQNKRFLGEIEEWKAKADAATADTSGDVLVQALTDLRDLNQKTVKLPEEVFVSEFADGAFAKLDLFSTVIWPYDIEELEKTTEGEFGGVGIQIEGDDAGNIVVVQPLPGTPAFRAGVRPGDIITRINGKNAKGLSLDGAVKIITGTPETTVTLTLRSLTGAVKDFALQREMIKVASIKGSTPTNNGGWNYMLDPDQKIGYVRITSFSKTTAEDLGKALDELKDQNARAVILDLRYDPGGLLDTAKKVVNKFIDHGVIVSTHADRPTVNPPTVMTADPDDLQTNLPLIVLVNQYSASASEIVSGALKDQKRALIVGQRTYGKGSVQMLLPLETKKAWLKLTTSHYYLPSGRCIHREENSTTWGVDPDVAIEMTPRQMSDENLNRGRLDVPSDMAVNIPGGPTTRPTLSDVMNSDPQLCAALLIMRLQLASQPAQTAQNQAAIP